MRVPQPSSRTDVHQLPSGPTEMSQSQALLAAALVLSVCSACLITNCPKGGKRSSSHGKDSFRQVRAGQDCDRTVVESRVCPRCGPAKMGHCYGADICCGEEMGCLMATADTLVCQREQMSPDPCVGPTGDAPCGLSGKCAAPGVCCTPDSCTIDASCRQTLSQEMVDLIYYNVGNMRGAGQNSEVEK